MVGLLWPALSSGTASDTDSPCEGPLPPHGTEKHITFHIFAPLLFGLSLMLKVCHNDIEGIAINLSPGRSGKSKNSHPPSTRRSPKCPVQKLFLCCFSRFSFWGKCSVLLFQQVNAHLGCDVHISELHESSCSFDQISFSIRCTLNERQYCVFIIKILLTPLLLYY